MGDTGKLPKDLRYISRTMNCPEIINIEDKLEVKGIENLIFEENKKAVVSF